ncbi:thioredoxin domain-containing protein 6-like isoform X5 [Mercenaria mercenaria]|uniref:thioredoxin domain-containing protein 6-like isoform X5 n=2 Tax=Mercenaria mercenaria TaxID=6596 RepID=UPI00234F332E|nr:thioredoxin domain-containing protein 6-like isoform X5 [Mercenaria mercenaria]
MAEKKKGGGMARKGKEIQLQREIETQEEWEDMLSKEGLCVVDAYSDWCGPTTSMTGQFKKINNELGDSLLSFVTAKADTIDALEKYRGRCEPCFLFYAGGVLVAVVRGANAPLILRTITEQLAQEHKVLDGQAERKEIKDTVIAQLEERDKQMEEEEEEVEALRFKFQGEIIEFGDELDSDGTEPVKEVSVVIIKPDAVQSGKAEEILTEMKNRGIEVLRQEERQLTEDEVKNVYTHLQDEPFFEELVAFMTSSPSIVLAITKGKTGENVIKEFRDLIGPPEVEEAKEAAPESLRAKFGQGKFMNAVHGSDSQDTAARELAFFFPDFAAPKVEGKPKLQRTLALIRPDAYKNNKDAILAKIRESGFKVAMSKEIHLTKEQAEDFYKEHRGQEYFEELTTRMSSGTLLALGLAREEAVTGWREMLGPTKVDEAKEQAPESLRAQFSEEGVQINMLHGSDSEESAKKEIEYFFPMEQTVAVIKPDAYGTKDEIISKIHEAGFRIAARKETTLSKEIAEEFYADHKDKEYYNELVEHMTSGPTCFMVLSREGAVDGWRSLIGPTDPTKAKEVEADTLRALYGQDTLRNAVHGSSNPDHAMSQIQKIFGELYFNKDGSVKDEKEGVPALQVTEVPSVDPDQLEEAIAEQQEVSYEPAPEFEREAKSDVKKEGKSKPASAKKEKEGDDKGDKQEQSESQEEDQQEQKPAEDQTPQQPSESEAQQEKQTEGEAAPEQQTEQPAEQQAEQQAETTEEKAKSPEPQAQEEKPAEQTTEEQTEQKPTEESKPAESQPAEEPAQTEQKTEAMEEPAKTEEEPAKTEEEPAKTEEEPAKTEEEPAKTEEPKAEEEPKKEETTEQKAEETQEAEKKEETPAEGGGQ